MNRWKISAILALMIVLISSIVVYQELDHKNNEIKILTERLNNQQKQIFDFQNNLTDLTYKLNVSEAKLNEEKEQKEKLIQEIFELKRTARTDYALIGVNSEGKGSVIPLEVIIKSGNGSLFLDVANIIFDETLQSSAQTAIKVAGEITKTNIKERDILISIRAPVSTEKSEIGGGSGGAAMTVTIIAAMEGRNISRDVLITGTVEDYHTIGKVGAVKEKAIAAKEWGAKKLIVPIGLNVSLPNLEIKEAFTIEEALKYIARDN